ncbi:hypothetical protein EAH85_14385 [Curtobacterium flaccumfaciens]|nr:hypothetical protein EAH85_14385 [Curtobacterium flaccumfaciens]
MTSTFAGGTVVNTVASDDDEPVFVIQSFSYTKNYSIGKTKPSTAWTRMHNCFNCYFPISGAPRAYPSRGQDLPLKASFAGVTGNFHCKMGQTTKYAAENWGWYFDAASGHVDGVGSQIYFSFFQDHDGSYKLSVTGMILNDFGPGNYPYTVLAEAQWAKLASNIQQNLSGA